MALTNLDALTLTGALTAAGITNSGMVVLSTAVGITAEAAGTQAAATSLTKSVNSVDTVAGAADGIKLPLAVAGTIIYLTNNTATSMQVFGDGTDTINIGAGDVATATGVAHAGNKSAIYFCTVSAPAGKWQRVMTA
jgi:imidazole glycerol phosphate synthase subunit HisF